MSAKEMFEKLDYHKEESFDKELITYIHIQNIDGERHFGITFNKKYKSYHVWHFGYDEKGHCDNNMNLSINMELLQAIIQQCKELDWYE